MFQPKPHPQPEVSSGFCPETRKEKTDRHTDIALMANLGCSAIASIIVAFPFLGKTRITTIRGFIFRKERPLWMGYLPLSRVDKCVSQVNLEAMRNRSTVAHIVSRILSSPGHWPEVSGRPERKW